MLKVGDQAPDFTLVDQNEEEVSLKDLKGKRVLLSFHPLAFTSVCTDQMRDLERNYDKIQAKGIDAVYGLSVDAQPSKAIWAKSISLEEVKILADFEPKAEVAKAFDCVLPEMGTSGRANIVIDAEGKIEAVKEYEPTELPDLEAFLESL